MTEDQTLHKTNSKTAALGRIVEHVGAIIVEFDQLFTPDSIPSVAQIEDEQTDYDTTYRRTI